MGVESRELRVESRTSAGESRAAGAPRPALRPSLPTLGPFVSQLSTLNSQLPTLNSQLSTLHSPARRGVSLMEVLISVFVLSLGLIGMAALLPLGRYAINETGKADRAGACGRAAMREIKIRHLLDPAYWQPLQPSGGGFVVLSSTAGSTVVVDPLGIANWSISGGTAGPTINSTAPLLPLVTYPGMTPSGGTAVQAAANAGQIFNWHDDLIFTNPEDLKLPSTAAAGLSTRPLSTSTTGVVQNSGNYSWFFTATPSTSEVAYPTSGYDPRHYNVSVVVCYQRDFSVSGGTLNNGLKTAAVCATFGGAPTYIPAATPISDIWLRTGAGSPTLNLRENEWIALSGRSTAPGNPWFCNWYRIIAVGDNTLNPADGSTYYYVTLSGPDWPASADSTASCWALAYEKSIVGVYTTTIESGSGSYPDLTW